jgi:hypothetical protein
MSGVPKPTAGKVLAFDKAHFSLINRYKRCYCPEGFHPPYLMHPASYKWTYLYAAVDPATREGKVPVLTCPTWTAAVWKHFLEHLGLRMPLIDW